MATRRKSKDYEAASSFAKPKNMVPENMQSKLVLFVCLLSNKAMEISILTMSSDSLFCFSMSRVAQNQNPQYFLFVV